MILRRLLRRDKRGARRPSQFALDLAASLTRAGLPAAPAGPDAPEHDVALGPGVRALGLLRIENGPPDLLQVTTTSARSGDLGPSGATGFHFLIRRERISDQWPSGRVEAQREFSAAQVGPARRFRWTAQDGDPPARAAADRLNRLGAVNDHVLQWLRDPATLVIEVAPEPGHGALRLSLFAGHDAWLTNERTAAVRDLCRAIVAAGDEPAAPRQD